MSNTQIVSDFYECAKAGKWEEARHLVSASFTVFEAPNLPFGGEFRGREADQRVFELVGERLRISGADVVQITSGGEYVVSLIELLAHTQDGSSRRIAVSESMRIVEGVIVELEPYYFDHDLVREVATEFW